MRVRFGPTYLAALAKEGCDLSLPRAGTDVPMRYALRHVCLFGGVDASPTTGASSSKATRSEDCRRPATTTHRPRRLVMLAATRSLPGLIDAHVHLVGVDVVLGVAYYVVSRRPLHRAGMRALRALEVTGRLDKRPSPSPAATCAASRSLARLKPGSPFGTCERGRPLCETLHPRV
jgi:hypothetical protein